jgi:hypothetical protein
MKKVWAAIVICLALNCYTLNRLVEDETRAGDTLMRLIRVLQDFDFRINIIGSSK